MARARQGGFDRLWPQVFGEPGFAGPVAYAHGPQCRRSIHVLWRWGQRLYRLPVACAGARRATESMRGRPMALMPSDECGPMQSSVGRLDKRYRTETVE